MKTNIRRIRLEKGMTQQQLAERMDVTPQTISNIERNIGQGLSPAKIEAYAAALGVEPWRLVEIDSETRHVEVRAYVQAGHYAESHDLDDEDRYEVAIPNDLKFKQVPLYGAEVRGPSMNRRYPEGTALVFTDVIETGEDITVGKRYIVERERPDGMRETTVKLLWQDDAGRYWLLPESTDPRFQQPIALEGEDGETVRILGRVRYAVARED